MRKTKFSESFEEGLGSEKLFSKIAESKGMNTKAANLHQDTKKHIDVFIKSRSGLTYGVDVKGIKRKSRNCEQNSDIQWIEFKNVKGNDGWLYGSADFIAFESEDCFYLVKREVLVDYCSEIASPSEQESPISMPSPSKRSLYVPYRRDKYGNKDSVMIVELADIVAKTNPLIWAK